MFKHHLPRPKVLQVLLSNLWNGRVFWGVVGVMASLALQGCGSLPSAGTSISMIEAGAVSKTHPGNYVLVPVTQNVVTAMRASGDTVPTMPAGPLPPPPTAATANIPLRTTGLELANDPNIQKIAAGDVVAVSIYTSGGGLFGPGQSPEGEMSGTGNSATTLPAQMVDNSGAISVPHAGRIPVIGHTPYEVEQEITEALKGKALEPSVIVTIEERRGSDLVTVTGDVHFPRRLSVPMAGLRIIDAVASAGGSVGSDFETTVTVLGATGTYSENYREVVDNPEKNEFLQAGDTLVVKYKPWSFTTVGATGQTEHLFQTDEINAEEALASVSGLDDNKANPEAVFVYRFEAPQTLKGLGLPSGPVTVAGVPVIYQINLREPGGLFLAKQFAIHDKDVILVGNAGSVGVLKVMTIIGALTAPAVTGLSAASGAQAIRQFSQ